MVWGQDNCILLCRRDQPRGRMQKDSAGVWLCPLPLLLGFRPSEDRWCGPLSSVVSVAFPPGYLKTLPGLLAACRYTPCGSL